MIWIIIFLYDVMRMQAVLLLLLYCTNHTKNSAHHGSPGQRPIRNQASGSTCGTLCNKYTLLHNSCHACDTYPRAYWCTRWAMLIPGSGGGDPSRSHRWALDSLDSWEDAASGVHFLQSRQLLFVKPGPISHFHQFRIFCIFSILAFSRPLCVSDQRSFRLLCFLASSMSRTKPACITLHMSKWWPHQAQTLPSASIRGSQKLHPCCQGC